MILQALYEYYTAMAAQGKMARRGWSPAKVSFALLIDEQGDAFGCPPVEGEGTEGKEGSGGSQGYAAAQAGNPSGKSV